MRAGLSIAVSLALMIGAWFYASFLLFGGPEGFRRQRSLSRQYREVDGDFPFAPQDSALGADRFEAFLKAQKAFLPALEKAIAGLPEVSNASVAEAMMRLTTAHAAALRDAEMGLRECRWIIQQIQGTIRRSLQNGDGRLAPLAEAMRAALRATRLGAIQEPFEYDFDMLQHRVPLVAEKFYQKDASLLESHKADLESVALCVVFDSFLESIYAPKVDPATLRQENAPTTKAKTESAEPEGEE
ncbi:MAG: hypothetical protein NTW86_01495 [Candidatus Sumerlaeota bacterium]|nr:hypothetical protein [Candidatus Sumerlaeota bacterium]